MFFSKLFGFFDSHFVYKYKRMLVQYVCVVSLTLSASIVTYVRLELWATNVCSGTELRSHEGTFGRTVSLIKKVARRRKMAIQCGRRLEEI